MCFAPVTKFYSDQKMELSYKIIIPLVFYLQLYSGCYGESCKAVGNNVLAITVTSKKNNL